MAIAFNVNQFKSALTNGGARPNQFSVTMTFPAGFVPNASLAGQKVPFLVTQAVLPGQTIGVAPVFYRGREVKFAGDRVFAPIQLLVLNDSDMTIRSALESWMNGMDNLLTKVGKLRPSEYMCNMQITQLDRNGNELKVYNLRDVFPSDIGDVQLDFSLNDTISSFGATFQYQTFTVSPTPSAQIVNAAANFADIQV
jgi:hypothetical protein